jgi:hypothetical protein
VAKRVFFSFHYDDIWRVNQIRNAWVVRGVNETTGFIDKAAFETVERQGKASVERWIDGQLNGTSTTIVLIGRHTAHRPYVQYEIRKSYERGNSLLGIKIDNVKDSNGEIDWLVGSNPFQFVQVPGGLFGTISVADKLSVPIYDWVNDSGRERVSTWIDRAPRRLPT